MTNIRPLGILLDTLQGGEESLLATRPASPVARVAPAARVAREAASEAQTASRGNRLATSEPLANPMAVLHSDAERTRLAAMTGGVNDTGPTTRGFPSQSPSASLQLSAAAQWLQRLLLNTPADETAESIRASTPLVRAAPEDAQGLATALRESIAQSGLFYESHLADWVMQRYPESDLRREPQAGWSGGMASDAETPAARDTADGGSLPVRSGEMLERGHVNVELLRAQLLTLELRQFAWQGELWPGQIARMTIAEDGTSPESAGAPPWRTHLTLTLPKLGTVDVDLRIDGATLQLALVAEAAHSVELLNEHLADLMAGLEAHGQTVTVVGIRQS